MATAKKQDKTMTYAIGGLIAFILLLVIGGFAYSSMKKTKTIKKTPVAPQVTQVTDDSATRIAELQSQAEATAKENAAKVDALNKNVETLTQQNQQLQAQLSKNAQTASVEKVKVKRPTVKIIYPKQPVDDGSIATVGKRKWLPSGESILVTTTTK